MLGGRSRWDTRGDVGHENRPVDERGDRRVRFDEHFEAAGASLGAGLLNYHQMYEGCPEERMVNAGEAGPAARP
jgi:hypothetical protein